MVGHGPTAKCFGQGRYRGAVADTCLMLDESQAEGAQEGLVGPALLAVKGCGADRGQPFAAVDGLALGVFQSKGCVAVALDVLGDALQRPVPGFFLPLGAVGLAVHDLLQARIRLARRAFGQLVDAAALGAQRTLVDGMVRVAFDVDGALGALKGGVTMRPQPTAQ